MANFPVTARKVGTALVITIVKTGLPTDSVFKVGLYAETARTTLLCHPITTPTSTNNQVVVSVPIASLTNVGTLGEVHVLVERLDTAGTPSGDAGNCSHNIGIPPALAPPSSFKKFIGFCKSWMKLLIFLLILATIGFLTYTFGGPMWHRLAEGYKSWRGNTTTSHVDVTRTTNGSTTEIKVVLPSSVQMAATNGYAFINIGGTVTLGGAPMVTPTDFNVVQRGNFSPHPDNFPQRAIDIAPGLELGTYTEVEPNEEKFTLEFRGQALVLKNGHFNARFKVLWPNLSNDQALEVITRTQRGLVISNKWNTAITVKREWTTDDE